MSEALPLLDLSHYKYVKPLGCGAYGRVYLVIETSTNIQYAAKEAMDPFDKDDSSQDFTKEISIYKNLVSPSILKVYGYSLTNFEENNFPVFISEYQKNLSLDHYICHTRKTSKYNITLPQRYIILLGIVIGMKILHSHGIIHRDLKPSNILLDDNFYPKICDFGQSFISNIQASQIIMRTHVGTPLYQAPEILGDHPYTQSVDTYSFSLIAYQLITDKLPFGEYKSVFKMQSDIVKGVRPDTKIIEDIKMRQLIEDSWSQDPSKRPSFDDILQEILDDRYKNFFNADDEEVQKYLDIFDEEVKTKITSTKLIHDLKAKASTGDSDSMFRLAVIYDEGEKGVKPNKKKAVGYYQQACDNDNTDAMLVFGSKLLKGKDGIGQDKGSGRGFIQKVRRQTKHQSNEQLRLDAAARKRRRRGQGACGEVSSEVRCLTLFAEKGCVCAMFNLGMMLLMGKEVKADKRKAALLMKEAADLDFVDAMWIYGVMAFRGDGVDVDKKESFYYLKKAADNGNEHAIDFVSKNFDSE